MNLLDLIITISVDDNATSEVDEVSRKTEGGLGRAARAGAAAIAAATAAAAAGVAALGKQALEAYSSYEQLSGGVKKLYGDAAQTVMQNADAAYKTAGMSANQYMEQATSFSAALVNSLGGDVQAAAEQTDVAMRAMSDNVNVFGSDMTDVQNAFQGFAKQNYTMLDNLKLGYGGTKEEMQRLIDDANEYGKSIGEAGDLSIDSFSDIVTAIELVQEKQGIAGTTAKEAATTIEGSVNSMKAAWQNWLTALGDGDADLSGLTGQLVDSVITAGNNVIPRLGEIFASIGTAATQYAPQAAQQLASALGAALSAALPQQVQDAFAGVWEAVDFAGSGLGGAFGDALPGFLESVQPLAESFSTMFQPIGEFVSGNGPAFEGMMQRIGEHIDAVGPSFQALGTALGMLGTSLQPIAEVLGPAIAQLLGQIGSAMVAVVPIALSIAASAVAVAANVIGAITNIAAFVEMIVAKVSFAVNSVIGFFANLVANVSAVPGQIAGFFSGIGETITGFFSAIPGAVMAFFNNLVSMVRSVPSRIAAFFNGIANRITAFFRSIPGAVANIFNNLVNNVRQIPQKIVGFFRGLGQKITSAIGSIKFPTPHVTWTTESKGKLSLPLPHVDWYAQGGYFRANDPTVVGGIGLGDNPRYDEVALPLSPDRLAAIGAGIARESGFGAGGVESGEYVVAWLDRNLPRIIAECTPVMGQRDAARFVRGAV